MDAVLLSLTRCVCCGLWPLCVNRLSSPWQRCNDSTFVICLLFQLLCCFFFNFTSRWRPGRIPEVKNGNRIWFDLRRYSVFFWIKKRDILFWIWLSYVLTGCSKLTLMWCPCAWPPPVTPGPWQTSLWIFKICLGCVCNWTTTEPPENVQYILENSVGAQVALLLLSPFVSG